MSITNSRWSILLEKIEIGRKGYKGPFLHLVILLVLVSVIAVISYFSYIHFIKASSSNPIVEQENIEIEQPKAEANKDSKASESEQITLTDNEEVREGDTFQDCSSCPVMVVVPAGKFIMGSPEGENERSSDEGPQHKVTIPKPFAVGKYEVTVGEYKEFINETKYRGDGSDEWRNPGFKQSDRHPVVSMSWEDATAFSYWLSTKTGFNYRLLTEAEWEYVARAGTTTAYHFGKIIFPAQANYDANGTTEVGSFPANAFGLYDVHGNVWEWVEDCWHNNYRGAPMDGSAWVSDCVSVGHRVLRGGSWDVNPRNLRSAVRDLAEARNRSIVNGFRIARTLNH